MIFRKIVLLFISISLCACSICIKKTKTEAEKKYDLVLYFVSMGSGIDYKAKREIETFLANYQKENNVIIVPKQVASGMEGEVDYGLDLSTLPKNKRKEFIQSIKEIAQKSKTINLKENAVMKHQ